MISVLIPARGRPAHLKRCLNSLISLAVRPGDIEILLRFDFDDSTLSEQTAILLSTSSSVFSEAEIQQFGGPVAMIRYWVDERWGYWRCHDYFNFLAAQSRGDIIINWNDDTEMLTPGWDEMLLSPPGGKNPRRVVQQLRRDQVNTADCTFPAIGRDVYEAMGHISLNAHCDAWIADVASRAEVQLSRDDIFFFHHCLMDRTHNDKQDTVWVRQGKPMGVFQSPEQVTERVKDVEAIKIKFGL